MAEEPIIINPESPRLEPTSERPEAGSPSSPESVVETKSEQAAEQVKEKYGKILSAVTVPTPPPLSHIVKADAESMTPLADAKATVEKLVALAQTKGVAHAVAVAQKLNDYYVLDSMHDTLADKFAEALVAKGLIQAE